MFSVFMFCPCSAPGKIFSNHINMGDPREIYKTDRPGWGAELKSEATNRIELQL